MKLWMLRYQKILTWDETTVKKNVTSNVPLQGPDVVDEADLVDMAIDNELHRQKILQSVDEQPCMQPCG